MAQIDLTPAQNTTGLHIHIPSGQSASGSNNAADFPNVSSKAATPAGKAVKASVQGTHGQITRFANPA
jgi:hypothetical protein